MTKLRELLKLVSSVHWRQLMATAFVVGLVLLTSSIDNANLKPSTKAYLNNMIERGETGRPVTTRQWKAENERLEGQPAKRVKRIANESADAVEEMAEIYPGNAKSVLPGMSNDTLEKDD
ncbi:MAG: hypothetical protein AAFP20_07240 [Cyanobacteria bacterium J06614_10]